MYPEPTKIALILAGGVGERFWPLSRQARPKQLLPLGPEGTTLLGDTIARIAPLVDAADLFVVTGRELVEPIRAARLGVRDENVLAEPARRNTAGALLYATAHLWAERGDAALDTVVGVFPADHRIQPASLFQEDVLKAYETVERYFGLLVMGFAPRRPETGYGYIETIEGAEPIDTGALPVRMFREKPDAVTAADWAASGRHWWNAGMFFWRLDTFVEELGQVAPGHREVLAAVRKALKTEDREKVHRLFEELESISIDYLLMEKAHRVWMLPADFEWDDLGAWDALARVMPADAEGNCTTGDPVLLSSRDCLVVRQGPDAPEVAVVGAEGLVVVVTPDAVLVCPREQAQQVREVVRRLRERDSTTL